MEKCKIKEQITTGFLHDLQAIFRHYAPSCKKQQTLENTAFASIFKGLRLAEKERFELSRPFWGLRDFQSRALDQLRDFSKSLIQEGRYSVWAAPERLVGLQGLEPGTSRL